MIPLSGSLGRLAVALALLVPVACSDPAPPDSVAIPPGSLLHDLGAGDGLRPVVLVRVLAGPGVFRFEPAGIRLPEGAMLRFVLTGSSPDAVVFDPDSLPAPARAFLRERSYLRGPLLVAPGQLYDLDFEGAPPGRYPFRSLLHGSRGMRGALRVDTADSSIDASESS